MRYAAAILLTLASVDSTAHASTTAAWEQFRSRYPYHVQTLALSAPEADGSRTLIISEPPPHITIQDLVARHGEVLRDLTARKTRVGFDGWIKDVTAVVPPMSKADALAVIQDLSRDLFGTSYKAYALDLAAPAGGRSSYDLSVGSADLRDWLGLKAPARSTAATVLNRLAWILGIVSLVIFAKRRRGFSLTVLAACIATGYWTEPQQPAPTAGRFMPLHGGEAAPLSALIEARREGVFLSEEPGLVAFVAPRQRSLNDMAVPLREFALDSDLILGAASNENTFAVIGRERQVPVTELPPLRVETILQLAAASTTELAQSYERTRLLAGKVEEWDRDWAPIYLSNELHDTEYGSLLNITDQLLKSWSEHGEVEYVNFPYPKPKTYPFEAGLLKHAKATTVTYNWNTKGVGYVDSGSGYEVIAFTRTGALPVDYLGEKDSRLREAEEKGYEYFASQTRDPNLARVVQYAGLYQIWRQLGVTASYAPSNRKRGGTEALKPFVRRALERLRAANIDSVLAKEAVAASPKLKEGFEELRKIQRGLEAYLQTYGETALENLIGVLVAPRDLPPGKLSEQQRFTWGLAYAFSKAEASAVLVDGMEYQAMLAYAFAESREEPRTWIKTPSIVLSWQTRNNTGKGVGGHNLSSRISRFTVDHTLSPGTVRVVEEGGERIVRYHPNDASKIESAVRPFARNQQQTAEELTTRLQATLRTGRAEVQPIRQGLRLGAYTPSTPRGMNGSHATNIAKGPPWLQGGDVPAAHADVMNSVSEASIFPIVIERSEGKYLVSRPGQSVITAGDSAGALDAIVSTARAEATGRTLHLHFKGVGADQARGFARVTELHTSPTKQVRLRTSVETPGNGAPNVKVLGEIRRGRWNWAESRISTPEEVIGSIRKNMLFDVQAPAALRTGSSLKMRVQVTFKRAQLITRDIMTRITAAIERWMQALALDTDVLLATRRLARELRAIDESIDNVEFRLNHEGSDILVVERADERSDYATGE